MAIHYRLSELMRTWEIQHEEPTGSLTFRRLAQLANLSPDTLNRVANQKVSRIDHETIDKLCNFFGCNLSDLMVRQQDETAAKSRVGN
ncbi:MAG: XRE family transcriptional regulator [Candidatus Viridilinea halotolerans]|uniref:XRE family transcriptional regulator n=1 Tax=Candidatus Viridilinea halotolerans TaxID=2491704 RepID=A0A426TQM3_9CHLR|nr:MAG: XRE family transcriptional regulator [Candidatus Viridilinea halotolerans]